MPLYEYQCQECGETTEIIQRFDDAPYTICSACGGALKKLISAPAIKFKGSGFYLTDYGKGNGTAATNSSSSGSSSTGSSSDSSSSSESASKAGTTSSKPASKPGSDASS